MKDFHCSEAGYASCNFVARGNNDDEIVRQAKRHAEREHHLQVTPEMDKQVRGLIHEESSDAHLKLAQPAKPEQPSQKM